MICAVHTFLPKKPINQFKPMHHDRLKIRKSRAPKTFISLSLRYKYCVLCPWDQICGLAMACVCSIVAAELLLEVKGSFLDGNKIQKCHEKFYFVLTFFFVLYMFHSIFVIVIVASNFCFLS